MFKNVLEKAIIVAGVAAGAVFMQQAQDAPAAADVMAFKPGPALAAENAAPERVQTLTVVPELGVATVVECRMEAGPADGAFRWETCVPDESPNGAPVTRIEEDGSASYRDGWTIEPAAGADVMAGGTVVGDWTAPKPQARPKPQQQRATHTRPKPQPKQQHAATPATSGACSEPTPSAPAPAPAPSPAPRPLVNLNTASPAELDALPNMGPARVNALIAARPYRSVQDLRRVHTAGGGYLPVAQLAPLVTV